MNVVATISQTIALTITPRDTPHHWYLIFVQCLGIFSKFILPILAADIAWFMIWWIFLFFASVKCGLLSRVIIGLNLKLCRIIHSLLFIHLFVHNFIYANTICWNHILWTLLNTLVSIFIFLLSRFSACNYNLIQHHTFFSTKVTLAVSCFSFLW